MAGYELPTQKPARKLSAEEKRELVAEVRENIEEAANFERSNRNEALTDLQFLRGDQWPQTVKAARGTLRPMITINRLPSFVRQVTNPVRESDIAMDVVPVDDEADPSTAKIIKGLIRQIEAQSSAKDVYTTANEHQAGCGIGWWQVCTKYVDDSVRLQDIYLSKIDNPLAVFCDPGATEPDRCDAMWMAVVEMFARSKFKRKWPKAALADVQTETAQANTTNFMWTTADSVAVAMYFKKVPYTKTLAETASGMTVDVDAKSEEELQAIHAADPFVASRECECYRVEKYLVSGEDVLEGPIAWPGKYIPLVPAIGAEIPSQNGTYRYGVVRFLRDPQQLLNFYRTASAEQIALSPKAPYIATQKQIGAHKAYWDTLNTENRPYLPYTPDPDAPGPPKREHPPETPVALVQQAEIASEDMKAISNIYDANLGAKSNETSGIAIAKREAQGATANSHYADNLFKSLSYTGKILIDLIPNVYDSQRIVRILGPDDVEQEVPINAVGYGPGGLPAVLNDLTVGRYDVRVRVGKSFLSKRAEAVAAMTELVKSLPPQAQTLVLDLLVKYSDWPGAEELAKRFRALVPKEALIDPNDPNAPPPPSPMDDPMFVANLEKLAAEIEKLKNEADKIKAEELKTLAEADAIDAETDHQIIIPSIIGTPSVPVRKPNGHAPEGMQPQVN